MRIGVVGATGIVGTKLIKLLEKSSLPISELRLIASEKSSGKLIVFNNKIIEVIKDSDEAFDGLDLVFFMATKDIALQYVNLAANKGCVVIDNSSAYRMEKKIPLIVPEVNLHTITKENRIIANPNCSTIQLVVILNLLAKINEIKRVDVSTYQAVSGAGKEALDEYKKQLENIENKKIKPSVLPVKDLDKHYHIVNNAIPQIDIFEENGYSKEEMKVINESHKILNKDFDISCTAVRIPVENCHSESVTVTFENDVEIKKVYDILKTEKNVVVIDEPENQLYPMAKYINGKTEVFAGRIRKDLFSPNILHLWIVADNLLKGAAANALQIAEECYNQGIYGW